MSKAGLRESVRARRRAIGADERARDAKALADRLSELPELSKVDLVLAYGANREEIDPEPALARLRASGTRIAYPRIVKDALDLHEVADPAELVLGSFSIREPRPNAPRIEPASVDVIFVPAVAFDHRGYRIGYGGGFYDRFLADLPSGPLRIGLAFDEQVLDEVPVQPHDEPVDMIVTPTRVLRTSRQHTSQ